MDSGRLALLEKAREFGSLAKNSSWEDFLVKSVTYRTLALYLGIQNEWWEEFWRSFSFPPQQRLLSFRFCCQAKDLPFVMSFLSNWFGRGTAISDISEKEFEYVFRLIAREGKNGRESSRCAE